MTTDTVLSVTDSDLNLVFPLFQSGFQIAIRTGDSLRELFTSQWGLSETFVETRISTIFIDGKPVDDLDQTHIRDGNTLALSCAMPGLVGATMRRDGVVAAFRSGITHRESPEDAATASGSITVKLFNHLIPELGPFFLTHGIRVHADRLPPELKDRLPASSPKQPLVRVVAQAG